MKGLWIIGLGTGIWGISLFWPGVNQVTSWWPVLIGFALVFGGLMVALIVESSSPKSHESGSSGQDHPSRPVSVSGLH
jgi:hypothetical protein